MIFWTLRNLFGFYRISFTFHIVDKQAYTIRCVYNMITYCIHLEMVKLIVQGCILLFKEKTIFHSNNMYYGVFRVLSKLYKICFLPYQTQQLFVCKIFLWFDPFPTPPIPAFLTVLVRAAFSRLPRFVSVEY